MKRGKLTAVTGGACAGLVLLAIGAFFWTEPAKLFYDIHGIDVSHHQGPIDWQKVSGDGVSFVFMKATEGGDFVDPRFKVNWREADHSGILRGAYHFFTQCRPGALQAENFIKTVPNTANALPPVIDAEHMGPCKSLPQVEDVAREVRVMAERLHAHYGKPAILYTTSEFYQAYLSKGFEKDRFWVRSIVISPRFRSDNWLFWQYHNRGTRSGIKGPVDLNVFRGTAEELKALTKSTKTSSN